MRSSLIYIPKGIIYNYSLNIANQHSYVRIQSVMSSVGIIGGGISGAGILHQLVQKMSKEENVSKRIQTIHCWEENEFGPGLAWSDMSSEVQLFNLPAGVASLAHGDYSGPFLRWCASKGKGGPGLHFGSFPPRSLFGEYAADFIQTTQEQAKELGITVILHERCRVVDVVATAEAKLQVSWVPRDSLGSTLSEIVVDAGFLCTGPASVESEVCMDLRGMDNYFPSPWPHPEVPAQASVAIIGTGLTAVDAVKQLYARGHKGKVVMVSRRGLLPTVKGAAVDPFRPLKVATPEAVMAIVDAKGRGAEGLLQSFMQLIKQELEGFDEDFHREQAASATDTDTGEAKPFDSIECRRKFSECFDAAMAVSVECDAVGTLRAAISRHKTGLRVPWQDCLIALSIRDVVRVMWSALGEVEKTSFQSRYTTILQVYFNAMPSSSAEDILSYLSDENCTIRGGLAGVAAVDGDSSFQLHFSDGSFVGVEFVINATGFGKRVNDSTLKMMSPLHRSLCQAGLVTASPFGGFRCEFDSCRLLPANVKTFNNTDHNSPLLYGVGHIISGSKLLTSGLSYCLSDGLAAVSDLVSILEGPSK